MGCIADMCREINVCEARFSLSQIIIRSQPSRNGRIELSNNTMGPPLQRGITMTQMAQFAKTIGWIPPSYVIRKVCQDCLQIYIMILPLSNERLFGSSWTYIVYMTSSLVPPRNGLPAVCYILYPVRRGNGTERLSI